MPLSNDDRTTDHRTWPTCGVIVSIQVAANVGRAKRKSNTWIHPSASCALHQGDCLALLPSLGSATVDAVITDPPYGVTDNAWDRAPPLVEWWQQIRRVMTTPAVAAVFCQQPFTTNLIVSNRHEWRYELVWHKPRPTGFLQSKLRPLRCHEHVQIFCRRPMQATYNPQMGTGKPYRMKRRTPSTNYRARCAETVTESSGQRYPRSVLQFTNPLHKGGHPTQKPLALLEWLVLTYTRPGDLVCDPYFGSGTTAAACLKHGRRFVGFERDERYFEMAVQRLQGE